MAVYQITNIMKDVRIALDQNAVSDALTGIGDVDTLSLDEIIKSKIVESVKMVHKNAPVHMLDVSHGITGQPNWSGANNSGYIVLPNDFMRLVAFKMSDWKRTVYSMLEPDDPEYIQQYSVFGGICGTPQKPRCAFAVRSEGKVLEFFSCRSRSATVEVAKYVPLPKIEAAGTIDISEHCYEAVVYTICSLVASAFGDVDKSTMYNDAAKAFLE